MPGYEIRYTLDVDTLGTHQFNKGVLTLEPRGEKGLFSDEVSGILYTCRGGFLDIAHVRDNADRTLFFASQIEQLAATGGTIPLSGEGAKPARIVLKPLDPQLVRAHGLREVVASLAEWLNYQAGIWHEITTWYGWASTPVLRAAVRLLPGRSLLQPRRRRRSPARSFAVTPPPARWSTTWRSPPRSKDALIKLGPLPQAASRRAFEYVDGIWWDSTKRVPDNLIVRHRNFHIGPTLHPVEAGRCRALGRRHRDRTQEFDKYCQGDWKALVLNVPDRLGNVPFRQMATIEFQPDEVLVRNGFPFPKAGRTTIVTQDDFPGVVAATEKVGRQGAGRGHRQAGGQSPTRSRASARR